MFSPTFDASAPSTRKPFSGRVLLTHHDDLERVELAARLSELGLSVRFVAGTVEMVETALRSRPTLVFIGLDAPGGAGVDAVVALRQRGYAGRVVGLLPDPWPTGEQVGRDCGCDHVLDVSVSLLELRLKVRNWLEHEALQVGRSGASTDVRVGRSATWWQRLLGRSAQAA